MSVATVEPVASSNFQPDRQLIGFAANEVLREGGGKIVRDVPRTAPPASDRSYLYSTPSEASAFSHKALENAAVSAGVVVHVDREDRRSPRFGARYVVGPVPEALTTFMSEEAQHANIAWREQFDDGRRRVVEAAEKARLAGAPSFASEEGRRADGPGPLYAPNQAQDPEGYDNARQVISKMASPRLAGLVDLTKSAIDELRAKEIGLHDNGEPTPVWMKTAHARMSRGLKIGLDVLDSRGISRDDLATKRNSSELER